MNEGSSPHCRLDSWKSIAQHLARSTRTVQRWHAEYGLPIHRFGGDRGSVFAYSDELDVWMRNCGRNFATESSETPGPQLLPTSPAQTEPFDRSGSFNFPLITGAQQARSAEAVALAYRMWETLSHRSICAISTLFREAIELDPGNAAAFAGLSFTLIAQGFWGIVRAPAAYTSAQAALRRAQEIDPEQPEVICAAAWLKMISERDWQGARRGFDEALKQKPRSIHGMVGQAMLYIAEGYLKEASGILLEAAKQNALSSSVMAWYCWSEYLGGEFASALFQIEQYRASGRHGPVTDAVESLTVIQLEEPKVQIELIESLRAASPLNAVLLGALGYAYAVAGQVERASEILYVLSGSEVHRMINEPYASALVLIGQNRNQEAVKRLEQSYREGSLWSLGFQSDPILAPLRNHPDFQQFLNRASYPTHDRVDLNLVPARRSRTSLAG